MSKTLFDHQIHCTEGIRTSHNKVVTDKYFLKYRSLDMQKFDVLNAMAGKKCLSTKCLLTCSRNTSIAFIRNRQYNLVVYLAIVKHMGREKTVFPMNNSNEML